MDDFYKRIMREALAEAKKGRWSACPNPTVGAVLVKDGTIVARGYHHKAGQPHAEIMCLEDARQRGINPAGGCMAVTLEPCNHTGRTGPCSEALIKAKVAKVIVGMRDPNPVACGGANRLRSAGVEVVEGICEQECKDLVADFLVWTLQKRPFVIVKLASTLDGRIATRTGHSRWVTSEEARLKVHRMRAGIGLAGGCVLVGGNTFFEDNPSLTARIPGFAGVQPMAGILSSRLPQKDAPFALLQQRPSETLFFTSKKALQSEEAKDLEAKGCSLCAVTEGGKADFAAMLSFLWDKGCRYVLCEGGGKLALSLLEQGSADMLLIHMAPKILGDDGARPLFSGRSPLTMGEALGLRLAETSMLGDDVELRLFPRQGG